MKKARHKKDKQIEAQASSAEQQHEGGSGDGAQPIVVEVPDSREGEKVFLPRTRNVKFLECFLFSIPNFVSYITSLKA